MYTVGQKLKECPFCGSEAAMWKEFRYNIDPSDTWLVYGVMCTNSNCIAHQQQKFYFTEEEARKAWNRRDKITVVLDKEGRVQSV